MNKGPRIHVRITCAEENIQHVDLSLNGKEGLTWEIIGQANSSQKEKIAAWLEQYCNGMQPSVELSYDLEDHTPFTLSVLLRLTRLNISETTGYQDIAACVGSPRAARAVGSACGRNPCPLFIPCHRVIASTGKIGGFSCGLPIKQELLRFEKVDLASLSH